MNKTNYILTADGKLRQIRDDELYHINWKYIKREKVNGKWRYWYKEDLETNSASGTKTEKKTSKSTTSASAQKTTSKTKTSSLKSLISKAKAKVSEIVNKTDDAVDTTIDKVKRAASKAESKVNDALNDVKDSATKIAKSVENAVDNTKKKIEDTKASIQERNKKNKEAIANYVKSIPDKTLDTVNDAAKKAMPAVNKAIDNLDKKVSEYFSKNMYYANSKNIEKKREQVQQTEEWQEIVARNDPEYVKTNADGSKTYLIDDYMVKKKHPLLDAIDDIAEGRDISINNINKDAMLASAKEYVDTAQTVLGIVAEALLVKFKYKQGSYGNISDITDTVDTGKDYVENASDIAGMAYSALSTIATNGSKIDIDADALGDIAMNALDYAANGLNEETRKAIVSSAAKAAAKSIAKDATNGTPDTVIINAAKAAVISALGNIPDELVDNIVDNLINDIVKEING